MIYLYKPVYRGDAWVNKVEGRMNEITLISESPIIVSSTQGHVGKERVRYQPPKSPEPHTFLHHEDEVFEVTNAVRQTAFGEWFWSPLTHAPAKHCNPFFDPRAGSTHRILRLLPREEAKGVLLQVPAFGVGPSKTYRVVDHREVHHGELVLDGMHVGDSKADPRYINRLFPILVEVKPEPVPTDPHRVQLARVLGRFMQSDSVQLRASADLILEARKALFANQQDLEAREAEMLAAIKGR